MTRAQPDEPQDRPWYPPPSAPSATPPPAAPGLSDDAYFGGAPAYQPDVSPSAAFTPDPGLPADNNPTTELNRSAPSGKAAAPQRKHSRTGAAWVAMVVAAIVLVFFLIFILQNSDQVQVQYLGWEGTLSLGVAMMFAALAGALTIGLLGTVRILQLRARAKRAGG